MVVHPHFHARYTGATRHVETVVPALNGALEARVMGTLRDTSLPRIGWSALLRRGGPIVWHAHRVNELLVGLALRLFKRKLRVVWTRHSTGKPAWLTSFLARRADRVISVSPEAAETLGLPSTVIGHGVDTKRFTTGERAWSPLGLGGDYGIGVIGRVRPDKGQGDFAEAVRPLLPHHPKWRAVLVGLVKPAERAWAEGLGLHLAGESPDVERWYRGLTVVVMPSHHESFGLVRLEAMAAGCCLVTTKLNAMDRMIEHGKTGFTYEAGNVDQLRAILSELLANPQRAHEVGAAGADLVRRELGVDKEARALLELYRSLSG